MADTFWNGATPVVQTADYPNASLAVRIAGGAPDGSADTFAQFPLAAIPTDTLDQSAAIEALQTDVATKANSTDLSTLSGNVTELSGTVAGKATVSDLESGLASKPDRYPTSPASVVATNYESAWSGFLSRFFDSTNDRLFPTRGLGNTNAGCPDTTLPDGSGNKLSPWQWCQGISALYERWKLFPSDGNNAARLQGSWNYFQTQFTYTQMVATAYGANPTSGLSDDNNWFAQALCKIDEGTGGDANALKVLVEYVAGTYVTYQDTRAANPITTYGVSTPGGIALQHNLLGIKYDVNNGYGDVSSSYEVGMGLAALYIARLPVARIAALYTGSGATSSATALQAAYLQLAKDVWTCMSTYFRFAGSSQAVAGIYVSGVNLGPANVPGSQQHTDIWPTTQRGISAFSGGGTLAMLCLSDALYAATGAAAYLTEMESIAAAYPMQGLGFGRDWNGIPCTVNTPDPWTGGFNAARAARVLNARFPVVTDYDSFKLTMLGTAKVIAAQSAAGVISPNWGPLELGPMTPPDYTWEQSSMAGYSGTGGGGQGSGRQIMVAASSINILAAAVTLAPVEAALGSGMAPGGIEILPADVATVLAAIEAALVNPMRVLGFVRVQVDTANQRASVWLFEKEVLRVDPLGITVLGGETDNGLLFFGNSTLNYNAFLGTDANDNPTLQWDAGPTSYTFNKTTARHEWRTGGNLIADLDGNGNMRLKGSLTQNVGSGM